MTDNPTFYEDYELIVAPSFDPRFTPASIPDVGVFDEPTYMLCINAKWWSHVIGVIDRLAEIDAWKAGTLQEKRDAVDSVLSIMNEIGQRIECGMTGFELRQDPTNDCILQQSTDGGMTWTQAFDYSLCNVVGTGRTTIDIDIAQTFIENTVNQWNIDVDLVYKNITALDVDTNAVYCHALKAFLRGVIEGALERIRNGNNQNLIIQAVGGGIAIAGAFIFGTPLAGFSTAIGVALGLISTAVSNSWSEVSFERVLSDEALLDLIVCCAYNAIVDTKVTELAFEEMLDNCNFTDTDILNVLTAVQPVLEDFEVFVTFLEACNVAYDYSVSGALGNSCDDCDGFWCETFDFTVDNGGWFPFGVDAGNAGNWQLGVGWQDGQHRIGTRYYRGIRLLKEFDASQVTSVDFTVDYVKGSSDEPTLPALAIRSKLASPYSGLVVILHPDASSGLQIISWSGTVDADGIQLLAITSAQDTPTYSGSAVISSVSICGTGSNPFD